MTDLVLDLNNFQNAEAEGSRYVLTSPRSLEACARMHVRPVQLLKKPLEDFIEENPGKPVALLQVFHDEYESKRAELLRKCRELRKTIIMENKVESKKRKEETEKIIAEKKAVETQNKGKTSPNNSQFITNRGRTLPRQKRDKLRVEKEKLTLSKSLGDMPDDSDINNNTSEGIYEVIPNSVENSPKMKLKKSLTPRKFGAGRNGLKMFPGQATFTKSKSRPEPKKNAEEEQPYMISTPKLSQKFTKTKPSRSRTMVRSIDDATPRRDESLEFSRPSRSFLTDKSLHPRRRSGSVDTSRRKPRKTSELELASSLKFANSSLNSGYTTPQKQRDQKIVEMMKEKRKQQELEAKRRYEKQQEWEEEKKKEEKRRMQEQHSKLEGLRQSHVEWEKKVREKEEKRVRELKRVEQDRLQALEDVERQIQKTKEQQERLQRAWLDERRRTCDNRKKQQMKARESVELEIQAFQEATEKDVDKRLHKAQEAKLERELKELNKVQNMNKAQRERFLALEKEVRKQKKEEEKQKKQMLDEKMEKAEILHIKKIEERKQALKLQGKEEDSRIQETKKKQEKIMKENEEYLKSIADHKKELLKRANTTAMQNIVEKSKRAQQAREISQEEQRRRRKQLEKEEAQYLSQTKEYLAEKDNRAKAHQQLKDAAIQLSRANARAAEAARMEVKKSDDHFLEAQKHAELLTSFGKGVRTGFVNSSSVKFG